MGDKFRAELQSALPEQLSAWDAVAYMVEYATRLVSSQQGEVEIGEFRAIDPEGSTVSRTSISDLRDVLRAHHIMPDRVLVTVTLYKPDERRHDGRSESLQLQVWGWFPGGTISSRIDVDVESSDKLLLMGAKAQVQKELAQIKHWDLTALKNLPEHTPQQPAQTNVFHGQVNVGVIGDGGSVGSIGTVGPSRNAAAPKPEPGIGAWIARTWKDHTATFAVTVVGGVLVVAVATWIGLNPA